MRKGLLRLALLGTVASLPALAQTTGGAPAAGAPRAPEARTDSVRPATPSQGVAAGQGTATGQATPPGAADRPVGATGPDRADSAPAVTRPDTTGTTTPNRGDAGGQRAIQPDSGPRIGRLEPGANSFTEGQARSRIEAAGFTNIEDLRKDDHGIWRGRASHGGQQFEVGLDFRGNVAPITR